MAPLEPALHPRDDRDKRDNSRSCPSQLAKPQTLAEGQKGHTPYRGVPSVPDERQRAQAQGSAAASEGPSEVFREHRARARDDGINSKECFDTSTRAHAREETARIASLIQSNGGLPPPGADPEVDERIAEREWLKRHGWTAREASTRLGLPCSQVLSAMVWGLSGEGERLGRADEWSIWRAAPSDLLAAFAPPEQKRERERQAEEPAHIAAARRRREARLARRGNSRED